MMLNPTTLYLMGLSLAALGCVSWYVRRRK
jgi:hypothetical protein